MAARKRRAVVRMVSLTQRHRVHEVDALRDDGRLSRAALAADLDSGAGLAIVTEGLLGYLPREAVDGVWRRFERALAGFERGRYISDVHVRGEQTAQVRAFRVLLSPFVRGRVHLHFEDPAAAEAALEAAGFRSAEVHCAASLSPDARGPGAELAHILEASTA